MILYFSGTGNSAAVAQTIARETADEALDLFSRIREGNHAPIHSEKAWVVVAPTYAWQLPRILQDWLRRTELTGSRSMYFVMTCGDDVGAAGASCEALCREKGMEYRGLAKIVMPENYIALFDCPPEETARVMVRRGKRRAENIAACIAAGETLPPVKAGLSARIRSGIVNRAFYRLIVKDKAFFTLDSCTGCGLCGQVCPMKNIVIREGRPAWQGHCTHCMACISRCPQRAIEYGRKTQKKRRYLCEEE